MFEVIDTHPEVEVQEAEYKRLLGYPRDHYLEGRPRELAQWARSWYKTHGRPWIYGRQVTSLEVEKDRIRIEGTSFISSKLVEQFTDAQATGAFVVAVSAGAECETMARKLWDEDKPDEYFFLETYGSAVVEHLIARASFRICEWADQRKLSVLPHYSPGYPGWDISNQGELHRTIMNSHQSRLAADVKVLDTGMLSPKKSLLAVFGVTPHLDKVEHLSNLIPCQICSLPSCQYRRVPYKNPIPRIESVGQAQSERENNGTPYSGQSLPLTIGAKYTFNSNALRKWSEERLQMVTHNDGSIEAQFRYEGTTCSNLGQPLDFLFHVRLSPATEGFKIEDLRCSPSPKDVGHKFMCEYLDKGESFVKIIEDERPLLGKPLDSVLQWQREYSPAACFCDAQSRKHKWGIVFEVLHFALSQTERQTVGAASAAK